MNNPSHGPLTSVQFSSVAQSCPTLCDSMNRSTPGLPVHHQHWSSFRLTSIESVMPSSHLILSRPLLFLPPIPPSISLLQSLPLKRRNLGSERRNLVPFCPQAALPSFSRGISSVQFSSVTQLCPTLCDPMNCSTPGLPVHHQLPESTQTHVH